MAAEWRGLNLRHAEYKNKKGHGKYGTDEIFKRIIGF